MAILLGGSSVSAAAIIAALGYTPTANGALPSFYDFVTGSLPTGVTLTRASTGWRYNSSGVLVPETTNAPRFQYDPVALTPRGLLIEGAATNNLQRSNEIDNAYWTRAGALVTADAAAAPDGTTTMDKLYESAVNNPHYISRSVDFVSGTTYAVEFFAKASGRDYIMAQFPSPAFGSTLVNFFNLATGTLGTAGLGCTNFIQHVGNSVYRCVTIATATATATSTVAFFISPNGATISYLGDGASGTLLWGLSIKEIDSVTNHIPTTSAAVTRAADVALITNPNALADQCWIVRGRTPRKISGGAVNVAVQVDDGSGNNRRSLRYGTDGKLHVIATVDGVDQCDLDLGAVANDTDFTVACRFADNAFAASLNGGAIVTDLSGANPLGLTAARIGSSSAGNYWNSTIRTIETRRTASNAELPLLAA